MFKCLISLVLLFLPIVSFAQITNVGVAYYGIQSNNWDCDNSFNSLKGVNNIHVAFLYKTFGMNNDCLFKFMADPRFRSLEIHLTNGAGLRKASPRWYELLPANGYNRASLENALLTRNRKVMRMFKRELAIVNKTILSKLRQDQACFVSPILEHDLSAQAFDNLVRALRPTLLPGCLIVNSPDGPDNGAELPDIIEHHSAPPYGCPNCINDLDGMDISFSFRSGIAGGSISEKNLPDFMINHRMDVVNFLWIREDNGYSVASLSGANEDPRSRNEFPTWQLFSAVAEYIHWAETQFEVPKITPRNKRSLNNCSLHNQSKGFEMVRNSSFTTTIRFPDKFTEQFDSVEIYYNGKSINSLNFLEFSNGGQLWTSPEVPYNFPYHIVIHAKSLNSSTDDCFYIKNPKVDIRRR